MVRRSENELDPTDRDERLGEALEAYLELAEKGQPPDPSRFVEQYPDLRDDLRAALDGLELVQGLVGSTSGPGPGHGLVSGYRVAGYKIVRELGRGGMGIVYEAVHVGLDRPVALKVLGTSAAPDSSGRRRFLNEARTAAGLHHTHIVPVFDVGQVGGLCYYAMQRIEGSGLDRVIKHLRRDRSVAAGSTVPKTRAPRPTEEQAPNDLAPLLPLITSGENGSTASWSRSIMELSRGGLALPPREDDSRDEPPPFLPPKGSAYYRWVAALGKAAAEALAHAHERGIIHRDVKPSNLLIDARGMIWMADFGLARRLADPSQTQVDSLLGTPRYMSPEQANTGPIDGRSDVYSLGATLYELLTLRPPFDGKTAAQLVDQIATKEPTPPRVFDPRIPRDLETIILKALAKRPADRYPTAQEFANDLERFLNLEPVKARRISPFGRAWRVARRHPSLTIVTTVSLIAVVGAWTTAYFHVLRQRDEAVRARMEAQQAAAKTELANFATRAALRNQLYQQATVQRLSNVANRRSTGLDYLRQAAELEPDSLQISQFRDEALALLSLRDVVAQSRLPVERPQGVLPLDDNRLAIVADGEDGQGPIFRIWDLRKQEPITPPQEVNDVERPRGPDPFGGRPIAGEHPRGRGPSRGFGLGFWGRASRMVRVGNRVAVIWPNGRGVRLFDADTGAVLGNLPLSGRTLLAIQAVPNGQRLVTIELDRPDERASPGKASIDHNRQPRAMIYRVNLWNPDHADAPIATLATSPNEPTPTAASGSNGNPLGFMQNMPPLVSISPNGGTIAVAWRFESEVNLFSRDGKKKETIDTETPLTAIALGPNDILAANGNAGLQVWDPASNSPRATLTPHHTAVSHLRFSQDSRALLAVAGWGSGVEVWDLTNSTATPMAVLPTSEWMSDLSFTPGGRSLVIAQADAVAVWSVMDPAGQVRIASPPSWPNGLSFGPGGRLVISSRDESPRYWKPGDCSITAGHGPELPPSNVAFDPHGRLVSIDVNRVLWVDPDSGKTEARVELPKLQADGLWARMKPTIGRSIAQTPDGDFLAFARNNEILAWSIDEPKQVRRIDLVDRPDRDFRGRGLGPRGNAEAPTRPLGIGPSQGPGPGSGPGNAGPGNTRAGGQQVWMTLLVSPYANRIYALSWRSEFRVFEIDEPRSGSTAHRLNWRISDENLFSSIALSQDGARLALAERNGTIRIVSTSDGRILHSLVSRDPESERQIFSLAFSPDGHQLAAGQRDFVHLWAIPDGREGIPLVRLPGHKGNVAVLAFDAEGKHMASGDEKIIKIWDLDRIRLEVSRLGLGW